MLNFAKMAKIRITLDTGHAAKPPTVNTATFASKAGHFDNFSRALDNGLGRDHKI